MNTNTNKEVTELELFQKQLSEINDLNLNITNNLLNFRT